MKPEGKNKFFTIVTAPHSMCAGMKRNEEHRCDFVSGEAAEMMAVEIGEPVVLMKSDTPRPLFDLNRSEGRQTAWRMRLYSLIREISREWDRKAVLIDVHSFPPASFDGCDVAVLGVAPNRQFSGCVQAMISRKVWSKYFPGTEENDITVTAGRAGIRSVLVEFNERLSAWSKPTLQFAVAVVAAAVRNKMQSGM